MLSGRTFKLCIADYNGSYEKQRDLYTLRGIVHSYTFEDECMHLINGVEITTRHEHIFGIDHILKRCKDFGLLVEVK